MIEEETSSKLSRNFSSNEKTNKKPNLNMMKRSMMQINSNDVNAFFKGTISEVLNIKDIATSSEARTDHVPKFIRNRYRNESLGSIQNSQAFKANTTQQIKPANAELLGFSIGKLEVVNGEKQKLCACVISNN